MSFPNISSLQSSLATSSSSLPQAQSQQTVALPSASSAAPTTDTVQNNLGLASSLPVSSSTEGFRGGGPYMYGMMGMMQQMMSMMQQMMGFFGGGFQGGGFPGGGFPGGFQQDGFPGGFQHGGFHDGFPNHGPFDGDHRFPPPPPPPGSSIYSGMDGTGSDTSSSSTTSTSSTGSTSTNGTDTTSTSNTTGSSTTTTTTPTAVANIGITMIEPNKPDHNAEVLSILKGSGAASDVNVVTQSLATEVDVPKDIAGLKTLVDSDYTETLNMASDKLQNVISANDSSERVVNMSFGRTALTTMTLVRDAVNANPDLRAGLGIGANDDLNSGNANKALVNFVTTELSNSQTVKDSLSRWQSVSGDAASKGIMVMVAGGNDQELYNNLKAQNINVDPTWAMSNLAFSNNVIPVGAIDDKNTASIKDDTTSSFGSLGSSALRPFIAADGVDVVNGESGTSFSTPQVAVAVQNMLEVNPNLTFDQVKSILKSTSQYTIGSMPILNASGAVNAAASAA